MRYKNGLSINDIVYYKNDKSIEYRVIAFLEIENNKWMCKIQRSDDPNTVIEALVHDCEKKSKELL